MTSFKGHSLAILLSIAASASFAQSSSSEAAAQGRAAGNAANQAVRPNLSDTEVRTITPGYTNNPPETASRGSVRSDAQARLAACQTTNQNDPSCQGVVSATTSANTPRQGVSPSDPDVVNTRNIAASPATILGDLSEFYPGCTRTDTPSPATNELRTCTRFEGIGAYACSNTLSVRIERTPNCEIRSWYASATSGSTGLQVQCRPEANDTNQHFRILSGSTEVSQFDVNMTLPPTSPPSVIATAGNEIDPWIGYVPVNVYMTGSSCTGDNCSLSLALAPTTRTIGSGESFTTETPFINIYSACPAGSTDGTGFRTFENLPLDVGTCYARSGPSGYYVYALGSEFLEYFYVDVVATRSIVGWQFNPAFGSIPTITLNYTKANSTVTQHDAWADQCPTLTAGGRCNIETAPVCVDGPSTKMVDGIAVTRQCWEYASSMSCSGSNIANQCETLASSGCTQVGTTCTQVSAATGLCQVHRDQYSCPVPAGTNTTLTNCPRNVSCIGDACFDTTKTPDSDFARAISQLEAARQAGSHLDPNTLTVFSGEPNTCRNNLAFNCCSSDPRGSGIMDSVYIQGSAYVYTLLTGDGLGMFMSYGLTSLLLQRTAGCSDDEVRTSLKEGARLCHTIGDWCSSCVRVLGHCVSCITTTTMKCCFNSILARVINEQGRVQIGKSWGSAQGPDCSGFTVAQLQRLNFATMDLSEFYASIVANPPDLAAAQQRNLSRIAQCYYGQGKCE
ncbi:conjugal transfer protein TraN [Piscinibacter gummiphilus]|uniref:Conjugal transfer protein TraN n=1 Tax=Piscinibacter gummiphilus TaxID=946333 RepID=A0ABZ0D764_9BURK|nr:conjugal transfer protein TraN [Piscinibacter gummiphilus]WOB11127.1 conjugal transfer protein TraN [Piscinibacter gummiphilus]